MSSQSSVRSSLFILNRDILVEASYIDGSDDPSGTGRGTAAGDREHATVAAAQASVGPSRAKSIVKFLLSVVGLVLLLGLLGLVPPLDRTVPNTPITYVEVVNAVVVVAILGLFVVVADELTDVVRERLSGPETLVEDAATLTKYLVVFLAFLATYEPLARAVVPFLRTGGTPWVFDLAFLVVALVLLGLMVTRAARGLDPLATLVVEELWRKPDDGSSESPSSTASG